MVMRKAKGKGKGTPIRVAKKNTSKAEEESTATAKGPVDFVQVRKNIAALVGGAAEDIASRVIEVAKAGQLAPAKYLFEAVGLYPPTPETTGEPESSLAYTLLKRLGLPTDPLTRDDDRAPDELANGLKPMTAAPEKAAGIETRNGHPTFLKDEEQAPQQNLRREDAVE